jgi:PAS domain S-box-containing protein
MEMRVEYPAGRPQPSGAAPPADEQDWRPALAAAEIGAWEWDLTTGRMRGSAQMFRNLGLEPRDGDNLYDLLLAAAHPDERARLAAALTELRGRVGPMRLEAPVVRPDGEVRSIVLLGRTVADAAGRPVYMRGGAIDGARLGMAQEVSGRKRAEAALRDSERRLRELNESLERLAEERARQRDASRARLQAVFDTSPDWLVLFHATAGGRFVYEDVNDATLRAYGLRREQVIGHSVEEVLGAEAARLPLQKLRACARTGATQRYTARRTILGVTRTLDVMFAPVPESRDGRALIVVNARDITELTAMQEQLRQAQKMETLGQLTGGVAHDFNNLLTAIIGNLELLEARIAADAAAARYVGAARRAAENGARLTEHLLAFSRRQRLRPQTVDLNAVVGGMRDLLTRMIGAAVRVETRLTPGLWPVLVDPTQIEIAVLNLAVNARDAMPLGGTLAIATRNIAAGEEAVPIEIGDGDCVRLSVQDTGTGMSEEVLRSAVEPFFTTKAVGKGSGLGLSQVYGVVRQSGGSLSIDSALGSGTKVSIYLPRAAGVADSAGRHPGDMAPPRESGRVLVVDDDPAVRDITVQMLQQIGYEVAEAGGGQAALDLLAQNGTYDLLVVDIAMPDLDGIETVRRARAIAPAQRVLYVTGYADPLGAQPRTADDPLINKPFGLYELRQAVRLAVARAAGDAGVRPGGPDRRVSPPPVPEISTAEAQRAQRTTS